MDGTDATGDFTEPSHSDIAAQWLRNAREKLAANPRDSLRGLILETHNDLDAKAWGHRINALCEFPIDLEETYLRNQMREVLLIALENKLQELEWLECDEWNAWQACELQDAFRIIEHLSGSRPLTMCAAKIRINRACRKMGKTLDDLVDPHFTTYIGDIAHLSW